MNSITANGAAAYDSTNNALLDLFALGGAYRGRSEADVIQLFEKAYNQYPTYAIRCLFYLRDCRGGMGERRFFRVCINWLAKNYPRAAAEFIKKIPEYGRWDDLYSFVGTHLESTALNILSTQLLNDYTNNTPTLCAKWCASPNASSKETRKLAALTRRSGDWTKKQYNNMLVSIRERIKVLERLMSQKRWDEIKFDELPSVAGLRYSSAFSKRMELKERYAEFMANKKSKVNASVLYPYECVRKAYEVWNMPFDAPERQAVNKYWGNLPKYDCSNYLAVVDTSGSMKMQYSNLSNIKPIDVSIALGLYFAEQAKDQFANHYITFSSEARFMTVEGRDFVERVDNLYHATINENTNLESVFELLLNIAKSGMVSSCNFVKNLVVISDMQIDANKRMESYVSATLEDVSSDIEKIRNNWECETTISFPKLYWWNVNASQDTILELGSDVSYISGASPSILKQILTGKSNVELMFEVLESPRYASIC